MNEVPAKAGAWDTLKFFNNFRLGLDKEYKDALATASIIGLHIASGTVVGIGIGYFLDKWLHTAPWMLISFVILGIAAGFKNVIKDTKLLLRKVKEADAAKFSGADETDNAGDIQAGPDETKHESDS